jgi:HTH-type transcriptional regulator/antitoxin HigA
MNIKPLRNDADHKSALRRIESLWGAAEGTPQGDELDVLSTLVEAYENQHYAIDLPDPIEAIKFRLEQQRKDYHALIGVIGQRTRVYEVMRRARPLSLNMIRQLHRRLQIPADVLLQPGRKPSRRASGQAKIVRTQSRKSSSRSA